MRRHRSRPVVRALTAVAAIALAVPVVLTSPSVSAATARTVTITPDSDLRLQVVEVHWTGFHKSDFTSHRIVVLQCLAGAAAYTDCYTDARADPVKPGNAVGWQTTSFYGITGPDGAGTVPFEVLPARYLPELDCGATASCELVIYDETEAGSVDPLGPLPDGIETVPLNFAPSAAPCGAAAADVEVNGEQSANYAMDEWATATCGEAGGVPSVDFTKTSGPEGRAAVLTGGLADVGLSSLPLPQTQRSGARPLAYAPVLATATAVVFRFSDAITGQPITHMNLSARLLARVLSSSAADVSNGLPAEILFDDPEFKALNPDTGITWPGAGVYNPYVRLEHHDDAYFTTGYIKADADAVAFMSGTDPCGETLNPFWGPLEEAGAPAAIESYPTDVFENRSANDKNLGYHPRQGTSGAVRSLFNGIINETYDTDTGVYKDGPGDGSGRFNGSIGITDLATALAYNLPIANLVPARSTSELASCSLSSATRASDALAPVGADTASLSAAYGELPVNPGAADDAAMLGAVATPDAYPLARVDYVLAPTSGLDADKAGKVADFLDWASAAGQGLLPFGLPTLPTEFAAQTTAAATAVRTQVDEPPTTTSTTTSTTTPTTAYSTTTYYSGGGNYTGGGGNNVGGSGGTTTGSTPTTGVVEITQPTVAGDETNSPRQVAFAAISSTGEQTPEGLVLIVVFAFAFLTAVVGAVMRRKPRAKSAKAA